MKKANYEKRIRNILKWRKNDAKFYEEFYEMMLSKGALAKLKKMRNFAKGIKGGINAKLKAVKKKFPEEFK